MTLACILGIAGPVLSAEEEAFFREVRPWGFILFLRNIETPDQVRRLTQALRRAVDEPGTPILVDQEGGRVQRFGPPHWPAYPPAHAYRQGSNDLLSSRELARLGARLMAADLVDLGVTVDCAPVADTPARGAHDIIGDRAYATTADEVTVLARAAAEGLMAGGVLPVIKHIPGHGRAEVDSHHDMPVVSATLDELDQTDFAPFCGLSDMPIAMTAHVVYAAIDPRQPATTSRRVIRRVVRERIGFDGLLISDDLSMKALSGGMTDRARRAHRAGCDVVLHCNGDRAEMAAIVEGSRPLRGRAAARAAAALARIPTAPEPLDRDEGHARLRSLMDRRTS